MPFRAKLKKAFSKQSSSGENTPSGDSTSQRSDIEYYKAHEVPKSKYRGKIDPEHSERLHAFSFADAFGRRASSTMSGTFSPGGTKSQSRRASWISMSKSNMGQAGDRDSKSIRRKSMVPDQVTENEADDTDVANGPECPPVSGSATDVSAAALVRDLTIQASPPTNSDVRNNLRLEKTITNGDLPVTHDTPFNAEDLEKAMSKASLTPRDESLLPKENVITA